MKFKTGVADVNGTHLQGHVKTTYAHLVHILGKPNCTDGDKTTAEWDIRFDDGTVATIYDWNTDQTPQDLYDWHVGGNEPRAVVLVGMILNAAVSYGW